MSALEVPETALVVLVGTTGAGKSTFARRHFRPTEVLSSDVCRGLVSDDENDQAATKDAFAVLEFIAARRLAAGRLTVVDATNVQAAARRSLVDLARAHDVLPVAIVLDVPESVCARRNADRPDRDHPAHVLKRQRAALRKSLSGLRREGFRTVHVLEGVEAVDAAVVERVRLRNDRREDTGPFDLIGDVHGCLDELLALLQELGYAVDRDGRGRAVGARPPAGRRAVFLGDLVDRGPDTPGVLRLVMGMVANGQALAVCGNHENKLLRALRGRDVTISHGLAESLQQLAGEPEEFRAAVVAFLDGLLAHYVLDGGALVVAHAGLVEKFHGRASGRVRDFCLYGQTTGETDEFGLPVRWAWAEEYRGRAAVVYGHTPVPEPVWVNNTLCLDTGCVFGGRLTALRYPERDVVSVPATAVHHDPVRPDLLQPTTSTAAGTIAVRDPDVLEIGDVLGRRVVETGHHGRVTIREENAAAALEVLSRFAIDPRWLLHLPPTMAPAPTAPAGTGVLEHPEAAFRSYAADGVEQVVCEEKHMGSRAVAVLCRDEDVAVARFGARPGSGVRGVVHTRTGRSFFDPATTSTLVADLVDAVESGGVFAELGADWIVLDGELLPWNAKADGLLREQFAPLAVAGGLALPAAAAVAERAAARSSGPDADALRALAARTRRRHDDVRAFAAAYRGFLRPVSGLDGVTFAPFAVLAAAGATFEERPHLWHLDLADRLVAAGPQRLTRTARRVVDLADDASRAAATRWWEDLTAAGGEGMVVKPAQNLHRGPRGLVHPGLKVRGREYLRLVYGPEYLEPATLERLRQRSLGTKRSLALREYALGLEGLRRAAQDEPAWRVHECVAAVLALESEPVDPRL
ncbi:polynucleotide kinase-phosphatase [Kineococcus gynurae]|uniref:Polynucleotide kinase-phosphatase n=1 Tax=Kineococcus gynurae TaxID=452979 RepID=A0ABV5LMW4_9ACTN